MAASEWLLLCYANNVGLISVEIKLQLELAIRNPTIAVMSHNHNQIIIHTYFYARNRNKNKSSNRLHVASPPLLPLSMPLAQHRNPESDSGLENQYVERNKNANKVNWFSCPCEV